MLVCIRINECHRGGGVWVNSQRRELSRQGMNKHEKKKRKTVEMDMLYTDRPTQGVGWGTGENKTNSRVRINKTGKRHLQAVGCRNRWGPMEVGGVACHICLQWHRDRLDGRGTTRETRGGSAVTANEPVMTQHSGMTYGSHLESGLLKRGFELKRCV